ncbi:MAG: hypothetical protein Q4G09_07050 [Clostridia bacterium]|nr:hypothetical protein [Clostridia bacterium]
MGQYYKVINIDKKEFMYPDGGLKLMEWSYNKNPLILNLMKKIANEWKGDRVFVVGDYAVSEDRLYEDGEKAYDYEKLCEIERELDIYNKKEKGYPISLYHYVEDNFKEIRLEDLKEEYKYIYNHNKKEYIDLSHCPLAWLYKNKNKYEEVTISPISLLLALGNGMGGGDFCGNNEKVVGKYINDVDKLEITKEPLDVEYPEFRTEFYEGEYIPYNQIENEINREKEKSKLAKDIVNFIYDNDIKMFKERYKDKSNAFSRTEFTLGYRPKEKIQEISEIIGKNQDLTIQSKGHEFIRKIKDYNIEAMVISNKNKVDLHSKNGINEDNYINSIYKGIIGDLNIKNVDSINTENKKTVIIFETQEKCNITTENAKEIDDFIKNAKEIYKQSENQRYAVKFTELHERIPKEARTSNLFYYEYRENEGEKIIERSVWVDYAGTLVTNKDILDDKEFIHYKEIFNNSEILMMDDSNMNEEVIKSLENKVEEYEE